MSNFYYSLHIGHTRALSLLAGSNYYECAFAITSVINCVIGPGTNGLAGTGPSATTVDPGCAIIAKCVLAVVITVLSRHYCCGSVLVVYLYGQAVTLCEPVCLRSIANQTCLLQNTTDVLFKYVWQFLPIFAPELYGSDYTEALDLITASGSSRYPAGGVDCGPQLPGVQVRLRVTSYPFACVVRFRIWRCVCHSRCPILGTKLIAVNRFTTYCMTR